MKKRKFLLVMLMSMILFSVVQAQNKKKGHEYVDLGLPSGTLWASCNIGAKVPYESGDYFCWGETTKLTASSHDYKWFGRYVNGSSQILKYNKWDEKTELDLEDDAAHVIWGGKWRMPSLEQIQELCENCRKIHTIYNGVNVLKFLSNINGRYIILPAAGTFSAENEIDDTRGHIWFRTRNNSDAEKAYSLSFSRVDYSIHSSWRKIGLNIRPVRLK